MKPPPGAPKAKGKKDDGGDKGKKKAGFAAKKPGDGFKIPPNAMSLSSLSIILRAALL